MSRYGEGFLYRLNNIFVKNGLKMGFFDAQLYTLQRWEGVKFVKTKHILLAGIPGIAWEFLTVVELWHGWSRMNEMVLLVLACLES